jgi:methanogenic corrinoid protein MtbC1
VGTANIPIPDHLDSNDLRRALIRCVAELQEQEALDLVRARLEQNEDPLFIVEDCQEGLRQVGERYERREYYLSGLIMAGEIFREAMEMLSPRFEMKYSSGKAGPVLLGTVAGDIHDIGKNIFALMLTAYGFEVIDLGVDVPPQRFLDQALESHPRVIGLAGLLTSSYDSMRDTIQLIRSCPDARISPTPVILGGNQLSDQVCAYTGANGWAVDAMTGVRMVQRLTGS